MPYEIRRNPPGGCPASKPYAVVNQQTDRVMGCHPSHEAAVQQLRALMANEPGAKN
jgi:hypothetical protein